MTEFNNQQFIEAHNRANGEGDEYITNLALELAGILTRSGVKINGQRLIEKLNSIVDSEGIETVKDATLLQTRLQLNEIIEPISPERLYTKTLWRAYTTGISMSVGQKSNVYIKNMSREFSREFKEHGISISEKQIKAQLSNIIKHQKNLDHKNYDYYNLEESTLKAISNSDKFIQNLCIYLQLAGHLE